MMRGYHVNFGIEAENGVARSSGRHAFVAGPDGKMLPFIKSVSVRHDAKGVPVGTMEFTVAKVTSGFIVDQPPQPEPVPKAITDAVLVTRRDLAGIAGALQGEGTAAWALRRIQDLLAEANP